MTTPGTDAVASTVDPELVRAVHRQCVTGVTVVTADDQGTPRGLAVNAFCSVSLEPPQVLVCVQTNSRTYPTLERARHFSVNILAADQLQVAKVFASKDADKFAALSWVPGPCGSPWLDGCCANLEIEVGDQLPASTHTVFIGRIVHLRRRDADPLVYHAGEFLTVGQPAP
jgi:flavin reductase (DIM6/NTAB) family NADH-FMN oxidoreductase RutF